MDKRGVSPAVGVIMMVAITIALSAVVLNATDGFGSSLESSPTASVDIEDSPSSYDVSLLGMSGAEKVIVQSVQNEFVLETTGRIVPVKRSGCPVEILAQKDGSRSLLNSFVAEANPTYKGDMISLWSFEECQFSDDKTNIIDSIDEKDGDIQGSPELVDGVGDGDAVQFDGSSERIKFGDRGSYRDLTVSVWVNPDGSDGWIAGNGAKWRIRDISSQDSFEWWVRNQSVGGFQGVHSISASVGEDIDGEWWHLTGVYNNKNKKMSLFVNGERESTFVKSNGISETGHNNMAIGDGYVGDGDYNDATIDEMRIYRESLNKEEIKAICEKEAPSGHPCAN